MINPNEISILVQGPILGNERDTQLYTKKLLKSIRKYFPEGEIILSTWKGENVRHLEYDVLVISEVPPKKDIYYEDGKKHMYSVNHQIISTFAGLQKASRKYTIKVRSDMLFVSKKILEWVDKYRETGKKYREWRIFKERVITLPTYNYRRDMVFPYNISDWLYFGLTGDLLMLFDIPLFNLNSLVIKKNKDLPYIQDNIGAEQYIWISCIKKRKPEFDYWGWRCNDKRVLKEFEISLGQNFVLLSAKKLGVINQKFLSAAYCAEPVFSSGFYTFSEWKRIYNKYGGGHLLLIYNPLEDLFYWVIYSLRKNLSKSHSKIYSGVINMVREWRIKKYN